MSLPGYELVPLSLLTYHGILAGVICKVCQMKVRICVTKWENGKAFDEFYNQVILAISVTLEKLPESAIYLRVL